MLSLERVELGKRLFRINLEEKYKIGGLAYARLFRALKINPNNLPTSLGTGRPLALPPLSGSTSKTPRTT